MYNNIRMRQLEARLALRMEEASKHDEAVERTENGYIWKDENGNTLVEVKNS